MIVAQFLELDRTVNFHVVLEDGVAVDLRHRDYIKVVLNLIRVALEEVLDISLPHLPQLELCQLSRGPEDLQVPDVIFVAEPLALLINLLVDLAVEFRVIGLHRSQEPYKVFSVFH